MTEPTSPAAPAARSFTLDEDVTLSGKVLFEAGTEIVVRKPGSGELRGMTLLSLSQLDVETLEKLAPRITTPVIVKGAAWALSDLMQFGGEVMDFLLPKAAKQAVSPTE
ncbi:phage tail protein [Sphingomonas jatrophae]|uniref:Phage tail assembly chaperone protein, E, or 41 or 14 n=1 Tax=Sphingomonas jatrophae TaxID=1166337 RepID=A0A1I6JLE7_9SPHN|nr:phage tail protein [Sphingomonas jatrophae]SFR79747.1 hypothetical protein SAMN05192580_0450 [Sphingomonas jatrophae]